MMTSYGYHLLGQPFDTSQTSLKQLHICWQPLPKKGNTQDLLQFLPQNPGIHPQKENKIRKLVLMHVNMHTHGYLLVFIFRLLIAKVLVSNYIQNYIAHNIHVIYKHFGKQL